MINSTLDLSLSVLGQQREIMHDYIHHRGQVLNTACLQRASLPPYTQLPEPELPSLSALHLGNSTTNSTSSRYLTEESITFEIAF